MMAERGRASSQFFKVLETSCRNVKVGDDSWDERSDILVKFSEIFRRGRKMANSTDLAKLV